MEVFCSISENDFQDLSEMTFSILSMISQEVNAEECVIGDSLHLGRADADLCSRPNLFSSQSEFARNVPDQASVHPSLFLAHGMWANRIHPSSGAGNLANQMSVCAADSVPDHFIDWGQHIGGQGLSAWRSSNSGSVHGGIPQSSEAEHLSAPKSFNLVPPPSGTQDNPLQTKEQGSLGSMELSMQQSEVGILPEEPLLFSKLDSVDEKKPPTHTESVHGEANGDSLQIAETMGVHEQVMLVQVAGILVSC